MKYCCVHAPVPIPSDLDAHRACGAAFRYKAANTAQADLLKKRETLLKPVVDKLNAAIAKVAKANLWDYILDTQSLIYHAGVDATPDVKKELGIK